MTTNRNRSRGIGALLVLLVAIIGVPALLLALSGSPLRLDFTSSDPNGTALTKPLSDNQLLAGLTVVCWFIWAAFVASVVTESVAWWRGSSVAIPVFGGAARSLLLAVAVLFTSVQRPLPSLVQHLPQTTILAVDTSTIAPPQSTTQSMPMATRAAPLHYTVAARDDLWTLAERHLRDPYRWRELYELNKGREQPSGEVLTSAELIKPGWVLQFPADAVDLPSIATAPPPASNPPVITAPSETSTTLDSAVPESQTPTSDPSRVDTNDTVVSSPILRAGLVTAGLVALLDQLRRRRRRHRKFGTLDIPLAETDAATENLLRVSADSAPARRLDLACRALAHRLSESNDVLRIDAVRVSDMEIEFLFDSAPTVDSIPFTVSEDGRCWTLPSTIHEVRVGAFAVEMPAPLPALVNVGSLDGADVLIDLERSGITSITGSRSDDLAAAVLLQLATNVWADHIDLITIGVSAPVISERTRAFGALNDLPDLAIGMANEISASLDDESSASTFRARCTQDVNDGWIPTVVVLPSQEAAGTKFERLTSIAGTGGRGLAVVVIGDEIPNSRLIRAEETTTTINDPALTVDALSIGTKEMEECTSVIGATPVADVYNLPHVDVDLREIVDLPAVPDVQVNVLGPVEVVGGNDEMSRSRAIEVVAYLALHPSGVSDDQLKAAVWPQRPPTPGSFNTTISLARRELGAGKDGVTYVLPSNNGRYAVSDGVSSDLDRFERLIAMAMAGSGTNAIRLLSGALELVRDVPFKDIRSGYQWAHTEGFVGRAEAVVADAAHALAQLHLATDNAPVAIWAARRGLVASPGYEVLYRDLMLACEIDGNLAALETIMAELNSYLDVVDPSDNLESETTELYDRLRRRRSSVAAG